MPTFHVDPVGGRKPRRLTQKAPEGRIQGLLLHNPSLLGHLTVIKPRSIVWFWHRSNGAGDLWGIDDRGHLVIVELKKRLSPRDERKAASQLRAAPALARGWSLHDLEEKYGWFRAHYSLRGASTFAVEFRRRTGRALHLKMTAPYLYVVAGQYTRKGAAALQRRAQRRVGDVSFVMMYEVDVSRTRTTGVVVTTERLAPPRQGRS